MCHDSLIYCNELNSDTFHIQTVEIGGSQFQLFAGLNVANVLGLDVGESLCQFGRGSIDGNNIGRGN